MNNLCANCDINQIGSSLKFCFNDWCITCDGSLWMSRPDMMSTQTDINYALRLHEQLQQQQQQENRQ